MVLKIYEFTRIPSSPPIKLSSLLQMPIFHTGNFEISLQNQCRQLKSHPPLQYQLVKIAGQPTPYFSKQSTIFFPGSCQVTVEAHNFTCKSDPKTLEISVPRNTKIKISGFGLSSFSFSFCVVRWS